jgi:DDE superfamily endonuclease
VVHRGQESACPPSPQSSPFPSKKNSASILFSTRQLWRDCFPSFTQERVAERAQALSLSSLLCLGRHTVTGLLTTCGQEFLDWSADYRLFSRDRLPIGEIFSVIRRAAVDQLPPQAPLCVAIDDTLLRKTGIRIPGAAWKRDPLGPHFHTNFVRAQRFLQLSADVPLPGGDHRMVPISFTHAPTPVKPPSKEEKDLSIYRQACRLARLSRRASEQIASLRRALDGDPAGNSRQLYVFGDGGYTNSTVLKGLPANTVLVGRIRKDASLYFLPAEAQTPHQRGRPRHYGAPAPTPEQIRTDESLPWQMMAISIAGVSHPMKVKIYRNLLWRAAGLHHTLQLMVIAPLGYRLRKNSKLLYRKPAFLICTEPQMDPLALLQGYVRRWDIEVNFREEKTLLGVGQAQVRNPESVGSFPAFQVASYAMLLLSLIRTEADPLPPPKWAATKTPHRPSTQRAINQLRGEVWSRALGLTNFSDLVAGTPPASSPEKFLPHLPSALLYATN